MEQRKKELNKINKEDKELKKIDKEDKIRLMTHQELSQWLRDCPNEFRECKNAQANIVSTWDYKEIEANRPVPTYIVIRKNYGKWEEPLIND